MGVLMLPGEREVVRLRPTTLSNPWVHVGALGLGLWALVLQALFSSRSWLETKVVWWQPWTWFVANDLAAHFWAATAPVGVGLALGLLAHKRLGLWLAVGSAIGASLVTLLLAIPAAQGLPVSVAAMAVLVLVFAELRRRSQHLAVTTLRLVAWQEFPRRREWTARHADLVDLELRQGALARGLGTGTLVAVQGDGSRTLFCNVARASRVRTLAEALVRQATATPYLRESQDLDRQVADALAALQRR